MHVFIIPPIKNAVESILDGGASPENGSLHNSCVAGKQECALEANTANIDHHISHRETPEKTSDNKRPCRRTCKEHF